MSSATDLLAPLRSALNFSAAQARRILDQYPGYTPMYTVGGRWNREGERWTHWCEGFFPGILWLLFESTGAEEWARQARTLSRRLERRQYDRSVHDLGFLFLSTYLREYFLTGEGHLRDVLVQAGRTLALRRQKGGYLASFVGPQSLFIDVMMNVGLIFFAARETADEDLFQIAREHCRTTQRRLVRPDGGTAHEGIFDVETGEFLRQSTHQGCHADSTWTRGLAWAISGFTDAWGWTCESEFLDTARRCADCYLRRAPAALVPPWDFDLNVVASLREAGGQSASRSEATTLTPNTASRSEATTLRRLAERGDYITASRSEATTLLDSSAAAIAASGLWDLADAVPDPAEQQRYRDASLTILHTLCSDEFLPRRRPEWEGILLHGVYHYHRGLGVDESLAWGDYFFVETLVKVLANQSEAGGVTP